MPMHLVYSWLILIPWIQSEWCISVELRVESTDVWSTSTMFWHATFRSLEMVICSECTIMLEVYLSTSWFDQHLRITAVSDLLTFLLFKATLGGPSAILREGGCNSWPGISPWALGRDCSRACLYSRWRHWLSHFTVLFSILLLLTSFCVLLHSRLFSLSSLISRLDADQ